MGHCNNIIIEMKDYLIVVDANFPKWGPSCPRGHQEAFEETREVRFRHPPSRRPCLWQPCLDPRRRHDSCLRRCCRRDETLRAATLAGGRRRACRNRRVEPTNRRTSSARPSAKVPTCSRTRPAVSNFTFSAGPTPAATDSSFFPKERILCTGDAIVNGPYNYTGDGNTLNWPDVIRAARRLDVERVLPGHGAPGGRDLMDGQLRFFRELTQAVQSAVDADRKLEDITTTEGGTVSTSIRLSKDVSNWVGDRLGDQVTAAYKEITVGKPHGEILGGK